MVRITGMAFNHPDYTIVRELGRGGSAAVFLAVQNKLNRRVALKVLHGVLTADPGLGRRFLREARIVAKLNHPHIVPVHDVGEAPGGGYFMAMEYLSAGTLKSRMKTLTVRQALQVLGQVAAALGYAHDHDVVHRDVKPDNILFRSPDHALLADFGIARTTASLTHMTLTGTLLGTPDYMSPEQVGGGDVDGRSDLYSLGVVLYELLSGHRPFAGESVMSTGLAHITTPPPPLPPATQGFQPCLDRALAKRPEDRYQSADDFAAALTGLADRPPLPLDTALGDLHRDEAPERLASSLTDYGRRRRRRWPAGVAAGLMAAVAGGLWLNGALQPPGAEDDAPASAVPASSGAAEPTAPGELERALNTAEEAFRLDRWFGTSPDTAVKRFRQVLDLDPDNGVAQSRLDAMLDTTVNRTRDALGAGDFERAESHLSRLREAWPGDERLSRLNADLERARRQADERTAEAGRQQRIGHLLSDASAAAGAGRWTGDTGALGYYRQVLSLDADNPLARTGLSTVTEALLNQAASSMNAGDFAAAQSRIEEAGDVMPGHPRLTRTREALARQRGAHAERQRAETEARDLAAAVANLTGRVNAWLGNDQAALDDDYRRLRADLDALLQRAPEHPELNSLQAATTRQADALAGAAEQRDPDEDDDDVFRVPGF